jgi:4-methyl-5(b-hydroxyethyl)-thiazole monophosphate biosynthesis
MAVDTLVRAGADVTLASVMEGGRLQVTCSRGVKLVAEVPISACTGVIYDAIVLPGGLPGAEHLRDCGALRALLQAQHAARRVTV